MPLTLVQTLTDLARGSPAPAQPRQELFASKDGTPPRRWRRELKYLVARHLRHPLIADLLPLVEPDGHGGLNGCYTARSLYLDATDWRCFHDTAAGVARRHKLRIRTYPDDRSSLVKFEVKHHWNGFISKDVAPVVRDTYEALLPALQGRWMLDGRWAGAPEPLRAFFRLKQLDGLTPVLNVQFRRRAFFARHDRTVRVTFDDALSACRARDLFQPMPRGRPLIPAGGTILEVKVDRAVPYWLHRLIIKYRLRLQSFSKYGHAAANGPFGLDGSG